MIKKLLFWGFGVGIVVGLISYYLIFSYLPAQDPDGVMTRDGILNTLKSETIVLYNDEEQQLGAFFSNEHRRYVDYAKIPKHIVYGLVAGEDQNYFKHEGFDPKGFVRALYSTIITGKKQGGSTLTQQAAKNLFGMYDKTLLRKVKELVYAKRLEYYFTKEQILEFYLNQFYVSGTGRGVAIAAKYFFNKQLSELSMRECAFIAGSVKGPSNYDPFIKRTATAKGKAIEKGLYRTNYILKRMEKEQYISKKEYVHALKDTLSFNKGNFKSALSTPMQWVFNRMQTEEMQSLLANEGAVPWEEAQLTIVTTLDKNIQSASVAATRSNLSRLQTLLKGYKPPKRTKASRYSYTTQGEFGYGKIDSISTTKGVIQKVFVNMGQVNGVISKKDLMIFATKISWQKYGRSPSISNKRYTKILSSIIYPGAILYLKTLNNPKEKELAHYQIEQLPTIQGANYLVKQGEIIAANNGFKNSGYDRITQANRQFGSAWKSLLYGAALENRWNYLDLIENINNIFQYSTNFYFPNPDHKHRGKQVSLTWAATRSENIASIYLLTHLLDKLPQVEYWKHAETFGMARQPNESEKKYFIRLRDSLSLNLNSKANLEIRFAQAKERLITDLTFSGEEKQAEYLKQMACGHGFKKQYKKQKNKTTKQFLLNNFLNHTTTLNKIEKRPLYQNVSSQRYAVFSTKPEKEWQKVPYPDHISMDSVFINGGIQKHYVDSLVSYLGNKLSRKEILLPSNLRYLPDFNTSLAMDVYIDFCKRLGITQPLQKVLSLPLGANDIHLSHLTHAYEGLLTGTQYKGSLTDWSEGILIKKVYNANGKLIFENSIQEKKILADSIVSQMAIMLKSVMDNGTGRSANRTVFIQQPGEVQKYTYPLYGKTGTTNSFRNAAFLGNISGWDPVLKGFNSLNGYTLGSYVGFDNNIPMTSKALRVSGASGALPQWAHIAKKITYLDSAQSHIDFLDFQLMISKSISPAHSHWGIQKPVSKLTGILCTIDSTTNHDTTAYIYTIKE